MTTRRLIGKVALVTGGSRGIGREIVKQLAQEGARFIGIHYATDKKAADDLVTEVKLLGCKAIALPAQFSSHAESASKILWDAFSQALFDYLGKAKLDILINNAGILHHKTIVESNDEIFQESFSINVAAPFFLIKNADPYLSDSGRIINLSSALTRIADPTKPIYSASKAAINSLTLTLAAHYGPRGITVNAVAPGVIDTDMNISQLDQPEKRKIAERYSLFSRIGSPKDVANLIIYLASNESAWTTGQIIDVSGGTHL